MKAKITKKGSLAFIETEVGQKAVVPWDNICSIIKRFGLIPEIIGNEKLDCINSKETEVDIDVESEGNDEEED